MLLELRSWLSSLAVPFGCVKEWIVWEKIPPMILGYNRDIWAEFWRFGHVHRSTPKELFLFDGAFARDVLSLMSLQRALIYV